MLHYGVHAIHFVDITLMSHLFCHIKNLEVKSHVTKSKLDTSIPTLNQSIPSTKEWPP